MHRFWKSLTLPLLEALKPHVVVEIGAENGFNTKPLWQFCTKHSSVLHVIDPALSFNKEDICGGKENQQFLLHKTLSLEALPEIHNIDAALIDGDHNWFTVYHELEILEELSRKDERPFPLVLLHDVSWPYARRDLYYNPETIPREFRNEYAQKGIVPGKAELSDTGLNYTLYNAVHEGTPRNGVLSAIEDFLDKTNDVLHFYSISAYHGYGILVSESRLRSCPGLKERLSSLLPSETVGLLFTDLEKDRLEHINALIIANHNLADAKAEISKREKAFAAYREELYSVYTSHSWRYTSPLRWIGRCIRKLLKSIYKH